MMLLQQHEALANLHSSAVKPLTPFPKYNRMTV